MIEVLHLIDTYRIGGPGKTIINSARFIDRTRYRVHAAAFTHPDTSRNEFAGAVRDAGIPLLELRETRRFNAEHLGILRDYMRAHHIDILHAHGYRSDVLSFIATRGMPRVRVVTTHHGWIRNNARQQVLTRAAILLSTLFDGVEVVSQPLREQLPSWFRNSQRVAVVPNGIVLQDYRPTGVRDAVRTQLNLNREDWLLTVIGRLSAEKGCLDMVDAFAHVASRLPHAHLLLVGEGPLESEVARRASAAGLAERTHFVAHQKDIRPYYEAADMIVSPSHTEGISNVILESLTFGVPVVAKRVGGNPEIITPERSGVLVEARRPEVLADAIVRVANDPALQARLVDEGQRRVREHFSFEARMAAEQAFYDRVVAGRQRPPKM